VAHLASPLPIQHFETIFSDSASLLGLRSIPALLADYGLLEPDVIISHATQASSNDCKLMTEHGVYVAVTPESEGQMALGLPLTFRDDINASLGVDCHFLGPPDLPAQMRLSLQLERQARNQRVLDDDKFPHVNAGTSAFVYNLATVAGARAVKLQDQIGSIAVGKLADLTVYDATSPTMICAAQQDPVTAIVRHSTIRDVDVVIVDGVVRKRHGRLLPVDATALASSTKEEEQRFKLPLGLAGPVISWSDTVKALLQSRKQVVAKIDALDMRAGAQGVIKAFGIDNSKIVY
jgi:cytosine/adenosine deaminase-related metal-dependent hydrolase